MKLLLLPMICRFLVLLCLAPALLSAAKPERMLTACSFEFSAMGETYVCTSLIQSDSHGTETFGPLLLVPKSLPDECNVAQAGLSLLIPPGPSISVPPVGTPWRLVIRNVAFPAEPGRVYVICRSTPDLEVVPTDATIPRPLAQDRLVKLLVHSVESAHTFTVPETPADTAPAPSPAPSTSQKY